jgi:pimeloyl-ACP methyl ester carboxylesterase
MKLVRVLALIVGGVMAVYMVGTVTWYWQGQRRLGTSDPAACAGGTSDEWVRGNQDCLHIRIYHSATAGTDPNLVVVLHGDAPFASPGYQYAAARKLSQVADSVVTVGMLRPGYTDDSGNRSSGIRGRAVGDNYTAEVVDAVAAAIDTLRRRFHAARVVVVGHSGGAAITGDLIGRHPGLADAAVLVSCPCDLSAWRRHMFARQHQLIWWLPTHGLSPMDLASRVDPRTAVTIIVGDSDTVAPPPLSRAYAARLREHGVSATLIEIANAPHDILLDPRVGYLIQRVAVDHTR